MKPGKCPTKNKTTTKRGNKSESGSEWCTRISLNSCVILHKGNFFSLFLLLVLFVCLLFFRSSKGGNGRIKVWRDSMKRNNKSFHRCSVDTVLSSILLNVRMRLFEGGDYLKYFHQRGAINRGTAIVREIRFSRWSAHASVDILHLLLLSASLFK